MRKSFLMVLLTIAVYTLSQPAYAKLSAKINLSSQSMSIYENGKKKHVWKISSGKGGFHTPRGNYKPYIVKKMHYSKKYNNAPMPYSVFFRGGYAIHGTKATWRLGKPASHGCIRLHTSNAKRFHDLVKKHGKSATSIKVVGSTPSKTHVRIASSSKITHLRRSGKKKHIIRKTSHNKRKYTARKHSRTVHHRKTARNSRYSARGFNSASYRAYAAKMRRKQARR